MSGTGFASLYRQERENSSDLCCFIVVVLRDQIVQQKNMNVINNWFLMASGCLVNFTVEFRLIRSDAV